ncbi:MAG: ribonuclease HIII [Candidatus Muiribacteriota bacterium]
MSLTITHNINNIGIILDFFKKKGFIEKNTGPYQSAFLKKDGISVIIYNSRKIVFQGKNAQHYFSLFNKEFGQEESSHIGSDETGKGDFFGPLIVTACFVEEKTINYIKELGVRDSKKITSNQIKKINTQIKKIIPYHIVRIYPEKFNILYKSFNNMNSLLEWAHQKALNSLIKKTKTKNMPVIIDKFANNINIKLDIKTQIILEHKAERHTGVAAASIISRGELIKWFDITSTELGFSLPKGCSHVKGAAQAIIDKKGVDFLKTVSKTNFKTFKELHF